MTKEEASVLANIIGCQLSEFPLKYLGVPLLDSKMRLSDWHNILDKVQSKLPNWKGSLSSMGDRLVLLETVLTATPLYMLSLYKLLVKIRNKLDSIRCQFLW
jgi:hypothetical protein